MHKTWKAHDDGLNTLKGINGDGKVYLLSGSDDRTIKIWSLDEYALQTTLSCDSCVCSFATLEIDGKACLASGHSPNEIKLWME